MARITYGTNKAPASSSGKSKAPKGKAPAKSKRSAKGK